MDKDINIESDILDIPDNMYKDSVTLDMYTNDSEDNNIRIRRQTTENIFENEENKNNIYEVKPNNHVYDIELGDFIKQEIKNIPKNKNLKTIFCGFIFFILALYLIFERFIKELSVYDDVNEYIYNLQNSYHTEIAYKNGTEYFLRVHNNFDNNNVFSMLGHVEN